MSASSVVSKSTMVRSFLLLVLMVLSLSGTCYTTNAYVVVRSPIRKATTTTTTTRSRSRSSVVVPPPPPFWTQTVVQSKPTLLSLFPGRSDTADGRQRKWDGLLRYVKRKPTKQASERERGSLISASLYSSRGVRNFSHFTLRFFRGSKHRTTVMNKVTLGRFKSLKQNKLLPLPVVALFNSEDDNSSDESSIPTHPTNEVTTTSSRNITLAALLDWKEKWETSVAQFKEKLPEPVLAVVQWMEHLWHNLAWHVLTFTVGAVVGVTALIVPMFSQVETLTQPVTLFETILADLEQAYVEPVDTNKLFETGVAAMLRSLDPYTEFEGVQEAAAMSESIEGKYGGVGLVIAGIPASQQPPAATTTTTTPPPQAQAPPLLQAPGIPTTTGPATVPGILGGTTVLPSDDEGAPVVTTTTTTTTAADLDEDRDEISLDQRIQEQMAAQKRKQVQEKGIRVVSAFEGYAFDYGMRVGDKLVAIDDFQIENDGSTSTSIEQVRNTLRGEPGTMVTIAFERDGVEGIQTVTMPRAVVRIRDVKLATLLGNPADGMGYIQLSGFASDAGREMRNAIQYLQRATEDATHGERSLQGLVLDLRGNPGGLLTSAVDVASLLVPKGSDIVSAKGRGFPGILYRSRVDPILDTSATKLAVLINGNTASAAEIVSGAVQDLDVGVIVGNDRTFGKGLVQNVEELPYNTALKFTVAKYYTPSGRCIQGVNYKEGDIRSGDSTDGKYVASKVDEKDRGTFYTSMGRVVRDGGGIEADYKVPSTKASALELTLFRSGAFGDFAAEWSKKHELTNNFAIDEDTYKSFQAYVNSKQKSGELQLEALYGKPLEDLKKALKASGYKGSEKSVEQLQARIVRDIQNDFEKYRSDIKEDISQSILARYLPESMLIERGVQRDPQVEAAVKLLTARSTFDKLLAKGSVVERLGTATASGTNAGTLNVASTTTPSEETKVFRSTIKW